MEKGIIIIGKTASGKSTKAYEIASKYKQSEVICFRGEKKKTFEDKYWSSFCKEETKIVIFDDTKFNNIDLCFFAEIQEFGVFVHKKNKNAFKIYPQIIIVIDSNSNNILKKIPEYVKNYFEIIECTSTFINREE